MKRLVVALAVAAVMVAAIVPAAMAAPSFQQAPGTGWGCGGWGYGYGGQGVTPGNFDYSQVPMWQTLADKLGMSANDLVNELKGGKSVADVAAAKGVSEQTLIDALVAAQNDALDLRVQDGFLTQAQADAIKQAQASRVKYMLEQKGFGFGGGFGPGGMMGGYGPGWGGMMGGFGPGRGGMMGGFGGWGR